MKNLILFLIGAIVGTGFYFIIHSCFPLPVQHVNNICVSVFLGLVAWGLATLSQSDVRISPF